MINQKGNLVLPCALLLASLSAWSLIYIKRDGELFYALKERLRTFTCMKTLNGEVKRHVKWMERLNVVIDASNAAIAAGTLAPPVLAAARKAKKAAQAGQEFKHFLYLKKLWELAGKKCFFDPLSYKTPYENKIKLSRDPLGRARLRRKKWKQAAFGRQVVLQSEVKKTGLWSIKTETDSYEVNGGLMLLKRLWPSSSSFFSSAPF